MDKNQITEKTNNIKKRYQKIHKIIFSYGIFFIIIVIAIAKLYSIFSKQQTYVGNTNNLEGQTTKLIETFIKKIELIENQNIFSGNIILGEIEDTNEYISSYNNLLTYKGFVIPRFFWVSKSAPIKGIEYFNNQTYSLDELDTLYKNIFIGTNKNRDSQKDMIVFPLDKDIIEDFKLSCLFENKLNSSICDIFTNKFLNTFYVYKVDSDFSNFEMIIKKIISQNKYKEKTCQSLLLYTYYNKNRDKTIDTLFGQCPTIYEDEYNSFKNFSEIQKELDNKFISNRIYKEKDINTYKLISFQQILNDDIKNKRINIDRINGYFNFVQELLKNEKLGSFYKELTYFFNNYIIKKAIDDIEISSKITNKSYIDDIQRQIISINNGNQLIGYIGLLDNINQNIVKQSFTYTEPENNNENYEIKIKNLLKQIKDIDIKQTFLSGNNVLIYGIREINREGNITNDQSKTILISTKLRLEENNNTLTMKQIMLGGYDDISKTINSLIQRQERTFADLQKYIYQNTFLFENNTTTTDLTTDEICKNIADKLPDQEVKICNNNKIEIETLWKNKIISIIISHNNFLLNNIDISDEEAKKIFNQYIESPDMKSLINYTKVSKNGFPAFIEEIIDGFLIFSPEISENHEGSTNTIIILERVKKYLGIQVSDILEKNDKILIDFNIGGIPFLGYYNIEDHTISPLYFKEANKQKSPVMIKNITLTLNDENASFLSIFLLQPLEVIKQYSPEEYLLYQKFISEK